MPIDPNKTPYNYVPCKYDAIVFIVLYGLSTLVHTAQAIRYRMWYLLPTAVLCGFLEVVGWSGRLWSSFRPFLESPFQMQITSTIIAPTPLLAAIFVIFGNIIGRLGPQYSRLSPKSYTVIFCTCDVISLVIQGVGGGMAASAKTLENANRGGNVMLGGIVFQLAVIVTFTICAMEFIMRYIRNAPIGSKGGIHAFRGPFTKKLKLMTSAIAFITTTLFIRAIYRTIELVDGWNGRIISTEVYFNVLDGAMVVGAIYALNFAHPGVLLVPDETEMAKDSSA